MTDPLVHTDSDGREYRSWRNTETDNRDTAAWLRDNGTHPRAAKVADILDSIAAEQARLA